ncbi:MAG: choice-of-anchor L domain-containing protein [Chitinophagales bacterium]
MKQLYMRSMNVLSITRRIWLYSFCGMFLLTLVPQLTKAQLIVTTPVTAEQIVENLLGCSSAASNIVFSSCGTSAGFFKAINTNLGIDSGVLISSGDANLAVGPNNTGSQTSDNGCPGYAPLSTLAGQPTYNAAVLDFDVTVNTDTLRFKYVFASEEYAEWVGTSYNDIFALWISGPGITGLYNMARVPGTNFPVTISNVNCQGNSAYYICNDPANYLCNASYNCPTNVGSTTIQYDGFTTPLEAKSAVIPGAVYHLTLAIADAGDPIYDSGVFIQANFLSPYDVSFVSDTLNNFVNPFDSAFALVEGCQPGVIDINLANFTNDTIYFPIIVGGTATNGIDYTEITDTIVFYPGDTTQSIFIGANADGIAEGTETIIIYSVEPCSGLITDSFIVNILDDFPFEVSNDTTICENDSVVLSVTYSPFYSYEWQPSSFVTCTTCDSTIGFPDFSTAYVVGVTLGNCTNYDTISIQVTQVEPYAGADQNLCLGDTTSLLAGGGTSYTWSPTLGLSDPTIANPDAFPITSTNYVVTAIGTNPLCHDNDTVYINVVPNLVADAGVDTIVCPGKPIQLWANGGDFYKWKPSIYLDYDETAAPLCNPLVTTTYSVVVSNVYQCTDTVSVTVKVFPDPVVTINDPYTIFNGESAQLFAHAGVGASYSWEPGNNISNDKVYNPLVTPDTSTTYYVVITSSDGCLFTGSTRVDVNSETLIDMPNAFTPNGDGLNDELKIIWRGPVTLSSFKVIDRWGKVVFSTKDLNEGWQGKIQGGNDAEVGGYIYVIEGKDGHEQLFNKHGNFLLLR